MAGYEWGIYTSNTSIYILNGDCFAKLKARGISPNNVIVFKLKAVFVIYYTSVVDKMVPDTFQLMHVSNSKTGNMEGTSPDIL